MGPAVLGVSVCLAPCVALVVAGILLDGFPLAVAVAVISAVGLATVGSVLWRVGARNRRRARAEEGTAMLEFAMVLPILLMLSLLMVQSSLLMVGNLCVNYAAYCAARCAIVTVPLHLSDVEPHNFVNFGGASGKLERIRQAAMWAVMPVSCSSPEVPPLDAVDLEEGLDELFGVHGAPLPAWVTKQVRHKLGYADRHTFVDLEPPSNRDVYGSEEDLTVTVSHTFYLAVPYGAKLFAWMDADNAVKLDFAPGEYGLIIRATEVLTNEGAADFIAPETFSR